MQYTETEQKLRESLVIVMSWIDKWDPAFTCDPDWEADNSKIRISLALPPIPMQMPEAWTRKTDITEWTDTKPETDGWSPLFTHPAVVPEDVPNEWRDVMQERFDVLHATMPSDPREAILKLVALENMIAIDPLVSSEAAALIQRGRDEVQQSTAVVPEDVQRIIKEVCEAYRGTDLGKVAESICDNLLEAITAAQAQGKAK